MTALDTRSNPDVLATIVDLDLTGPTKRVATSQSGPHWEQHIAQEMELEYRRFLYLNALYPEMPIAPSPMVDSYWHQHIIDTHRYAEDCQQVLGRFLHHQPCGNGDAEVDRIGREAMCATLGLYREHFPDGNIHYWRDETIYSDGGPDTIDVPSECYSTPSPNGG